MDRSNNCEAWARTGRCKTDRWVMVNCLLSCKRYDLCDPEPIKPIGKCNNIHLIVPILASAIKNSLPKKLNKKYMSYVNVKFFSFLGPSCVSPLGVGWDNRLPNNNFYGTSTFGPGENNQFLINFLHIKQEIRIISFSRR